MQKPDFEVDGWCLESGEAYHNAAPDSFRIPDRNQREGLQPGDFAKLIFCIKSGDEDPSVALEQMWVIVKERTAYGYIGVLDNEPCALEENDKFWRGTELPFSAEHVIDLMKRDKRAWRLPWRR